VIDMLMTTEAIDLEKLHKALEGSGRSYFIAKYPDLMAWYDRHIVSTSGLQCPLVQASLMAIWRQEIESNAESFYDSLRTGNWS